MASIRLDLFAAVVLAAMIAPIMADLAEDEKRLERLSEEEFQTTDEIVGIFNAIENKDIVKIGEMTIRAILDRENQAPTLKDCQPDAIIIRDFYGKFIYDSTLESNLQKFREPSYIRLMSFCAENIIEAVEAGITDVDKGRFKFFYNMWNIYHHGGHGNYDNAEMIVDDPIGGGQGLLKKIEYFCIALRSHPMDIIRRINNLKYRSKLRLSEDVQAKVNAVGSTLDGDCYETKWPVSFAEAVSNNS